DERDAAHLLHDSRVWGEGPIVSILADVCLPLDRHHTDDRERLSLDADRLPDRIDVGTEELVADGRTQDDDLGRSRDVLRGKERTELDRPGIDKRIVDVCSFEL